MASRYVGPKPHHAPRADERPRRVEAPPPVYFTGSYSDPPPIGGDYLYRFILTAVLYVAAMAIIWGVL